MVKNMGFLWYFSLVCVFQTQIINQLAKTVIISCCPVYERVSPCNVLISAPIFHDAISDLKKHLIFIIFNEIFLQSATSKENRELL